jgi:oxygen-dependent protoporphyrinogen oxidase
MADAGTSVEVAVVGAGIAGLAAAWTLRDSELLVLEADERIGGRIRSERRGSYWLNLGAHVFGGPDTATGRLLAETGVDAVAVPGALAAVAYRGALLRGGRVETYPFRLPLSARERLALVRAGVRLRLAVARYDRVLRRREGETEAERQERALGFMNDRSFADFAGSLPAGADALFRPTVTRSSAEPEELAAGHGVGYFHLVWRAGEGLSRVIPGGSSTLPERIAGALGDRVVTGPTLTNVNDFRAILVERADRP